MSGAFTLPAHLKLPADLARANKAAIAADEELSAAREANGATQRAWRAAGRADQVAVEAAVAAGKPSPKPTKPDLEAKAKQAYSRLKAAEKVARKRHRDLRDAIRATPSYAADRQADADQAHADLVAAIEALPKLWLAFDEARALARPAQAILDGASGTVVDGTYRPGKFERRLERAVNSRRTHPIRVEAIIEALADLQLAADRAAQGIDLKAAA